MSLQNLQHDFKEAVFANSGEDIVKPTANLSIYNNNITSNLVNALMKTYPLVCKLIGEDFFYLTAKNYIKQYPSLSGNLYDYGAYFSDFVAELPSLHHLIYLREVAKYEWICHQIYFAADAQTLDVVKLKQCTPENYSHLQFQLHPASYVMKFHFPILKIIELCNGNNEEVDLDDEGINLLIIRKELKINLLPITEADYAFLAALQHGDFLESALESAVAIDNNFALDERLQHWVREQVIVDVLL